MAKNKKIKKTNTNNKVLVGQTAKGLSQLSGKGNAVTTGFGAKTSKRVLNITGISKTSSAVNLNADSAPELHESEEQLESDCVDHSLIREPINLGVKNVRQILTCIKDSTLEVKDLILNECNVIYECKICRNLFRSLVNFIAHKRIHCKQHFCERMLLFDSNHIHFNDQNDTNCDEDNDNDDEDITPDPNVQLLDPCTHSAALEIVSPVSSSTKSSSTENINPNKEQTVVSQKRKFIENCIKKTEDEKQKQEDSDQMELHLTSIQSNPNAVFQSVKTIDSDDTSEPTVNRKQIISELFKAAKDSRQLKDSQAIKRQRVEEILPPVDNENELSDQNESAVNETLKCDICDSTFMSTKTLRVHMKTIHSTNRLVYPCPLCSLVFKQLSNATRHLIQIHKRSKTQANNLKEVMKRRAYSTNSSENSSEVEDNSDEDIEGVVGVIEGVEVVQMKETVERRTCGKRLKIPNRFYINEIQNHSKPTERHPPRISSACVYNCGNVFDWAPAKRSHEKSCRKRPKDIETNATTTTATTTTTTTTTTTPSHETNGVSHPTQSTKTFRYGSDSSSDQKSSIVPNHTSSASTSSTNLILPTDVEQKICEFADLKSLGCGLCPQQDFMNLNQLLQHAVTHIGYSIYKCHGCSYHSIYEHDMKYHLMNDHNINEDMIGKHYQTLPNLTQHRLMILPMKSETTVNTTNGPISSVERETDPQSPERNSKLKIHLRNMGNTAKKCYEIVDK